MNVGSSRRWRGDMTDIVASGDTILTPVGMAATPFPAPSGEVNPDRGAAVSSWRVATCEPTEQAYQSDLSGAPGVGSLRPCRTLERLDISEPGAGEGRMTAAACRTCGTEPLENARFCHGCGSPLDESATHAEYKQVTVLFADVVHSMDIAAAVGAERLREIMAELLDRSSVTVMRYDGSLSQFTGDGMMTVFGAPITLEDHAVRACLAALGIQEEAKRLGAEVHDRDGVDLQVRVGLNSGQVIAGEIGSGALGYTAIGEQVGVAQRMEAAAPPGGVMLSESTARLVEG